MSIETVNEPAIAGGRVKPRVERSGTLGNPAKRFQAHEIGARGSDGGVCRPLRGLVLINYGNPGFRFAPPWPLLFRLLRRLVVGFPSRAPSLRRRAGFTLVFFCLLSPAAAPTALAQSKPDKSYFVYVLSEAADKISLISFGPAGAHIDHDVPTGDMPIDIDGPHGIAISPDKQFYYVSLAHGRPFGSVWKYSTKDDRVVGKTRLGLFPATMDLSPDGSLLYVVNFNLHGDMVPSSVSVVATEPMLEVRRIQTCAMPHGSRLNPQGTKHYSACMMDDMLVEIDTETLKVSRHFLLTKGHEIGMSGAPAAVPHDLPGKGSAATQSQHMDMGGHGMEPPKPGDVSCSPTWAQPSVDGSSVFVACNKSDEIVEVDTTKWTVKRRLPARPGVYNLAITKDGKRLLATNKRDQSVTVVDITSGRELARIPTQRKVLHGVVVTPDDRYAFVSVEGVGSEPGTVEIIDLVTLKTAARIDVPEEAAGIEFFKADPAQ